MNSLEWLRMPLFTVLSGYVYAMHRADFPNLDRFMWKKARRLLLPFAVVAATYWGIKVLVLHEPSPPLWAVYLFSYEHFWFLQAIITIFLVVGIVDAVARPSVSWLALAVCLLAVSSHAFYNEATHVFAFWRTLYLAPYFVFGMLLREDPRWLKMPSLWCAAAIIALAGLVLHQMSLNGSVGPFLRANFLATLTGFSLTYLVLALIPPVKPLAWIGAYAFTIYLWHSLANGAIRPLLVHLGLDVWALFAGGMLSGILLPIVLHQVASRSRWLSWPLTGTEPNG
jgi:fucose 4-O-acetylase-like acetyltransferase